MLRFLIYGKAWRGKKAGVLNAVPVIFALLFAFFRFSRRQNSQPHRKRR